VDLDDELGRLFADDRLDVPVRAGAVEAVVSGARRVRRRRIALASAGGAMAVTALVVGGIALAGVGGTQSLPPASQNTVTISQTSSVVPTTRVIMPTLVPGNTATGSQSIMPRKSTPPATSVTTTPPPASSAAIPAGRLIGPMAYGDVQLGTSWDVMRASGVVDEARKQVTPSGCLKYPLRIGGKNDGFVWGAEEAGVQGLAPNQLVHTPEGAQIGWPIERVRDIYVNANMEVVDLGGGTLEVRSPIGVGPRYRFGFGNGTVTSIGITTSGQYCVS